MGSCASCRKDTVARSPVHSKYEDPLTHVRVLLLGTGESGKTTFAKQLTFLYHRALGVDERKPHVQDLQFNTSQTMSMLITHANRFGYPWTDEEKRYVEMLNGHQHMRVLTPELADGIAKLWASESVQKTFARRGEFWLLEAAQYYCANVQRFASPDFVPTDEDIILARKRTTGAAESKYDLDGLRWTVVDIGGQRSERRKWLPQFAGIDAVLWFVNVAGFDKPLFEDSGINSIQESLATFELTMAHKAMEDVSVFIFLNKMDLLREQLAAGAQIKPGVPQYNGANDEKSFVEFLIQQLQSRLPKGKTIAGVHTLSTKSREEVREAFKVVRIALGKGRDERSILGSPKRGTATRTNTTMTDTHSELSVPDSTPRAGSISSPKQGRDRNRSISEHQITTMSTNGSQTSLPPGAVLD